MEHGYPLIVGKNTTNPFWETNDLTDAPFGPDYVWESQEEFNTATKRMKMTPYQMAREFRQVFGQTVDFSGDTHEAFDSSEDDTAFRLVTEEYAEVYEAYDEELTADTGSEELLKELADLVYVVYGYAAFRGWNLDKAVSRVHLSNMTKIDPVTGTVIKREDGKVLKPTTYKPPYLRDLV